MSLLSGTVLSDFPSTQPITPDMSFVATFDNGDGTFTDYNVNSSTLLAYAAANNKKIITVPVDGTTLTDSFFLTNTISEITTNGQSYIVGVDFTQTGNTITGVTITFVLNQVLIAKV